MATLPSLKELMVPNDTGGWRGPKVSLDVVAKRKNPFPAHSKINLNYTPFGFRSWSSSVI